MEHSEIVGEAKPNIFKFINYRKILFLDDNGGFFVTYRKMYPLTFAFGETKMYEAKRNNENFIKNINFLK